MSEIVITDDAAAQRLTAAVDGTAAGLIDYSIAGTRYVIRHTEVFPAFEGTGVGSALVRFALDDVRARDGFEVVPICPFAAAWIMRHPEYAELVTPSMRGQFEQQGS
ncbi:MAG TPA: GNAT family N-acetyltransferase [Baekduia sp.]|nr:GNAT family N-acetyltransferase [Baekduia sp.]